MYLSLDSVVHRLRTGGRLSPDATKLVCVVAVATVIGLAAIRCLPHARTWGKMDANKIVSPWNASNAPPACISRKAVRMVDPRQRRTVSAQRVGWHSTNVSAHAP